MQRLLFLIFIVVLGIAGFRSPIRRCCGELHHAGHFWCRSFGRLPECYPALLWKLGNGTTRFPGLARYSQGLGDLLSTINQALAAVTITKVRSSP